jgi:hypothetical protein
VNKSNKDNSTDMAYIDGGYVKSSPPPEVFVRKVIPLKENKTNDSPKKG